MLKLHEVGARSLRNLLGERVLAQDDGRSLVVLSQKGRLSAEGEMASSLTALLGRGELLDAASAEPVARTLRVDLSALAPMTPVPTAVPEPSVVLTTPVTDPAWLMPREGEEPRVWLARIAPGWELSAHAMTPAFSRFAEFLNQGPAAAAVSPTDATITTEGAQSE